MTNGLFSQHSCQVVHHRAPKLTETENTYKYNRSFKKKEIVRPLYLN